AGDVNEVSRIRSHRLQVERFEDVENLRDMNTAGTGRWEANDLKSTVGGDDRFAQLDLVSAKIFGAQQPAVLLHPVASLLGKRPLVKPAEAVFRNRPISFGQVSLFQTFSFFPRLSIGVEKNGARCGELS